MRPTNALIESFREQLRWCDRLGSPFSARLLDWLADDWPDGTERTLARAHPHGEWVEWLV